MPFFTTLPSLLGVVALLAASPVSRHRTDYDMAEGVVKSAQYHVRNGYPGRQTCSGFVETVYADVGVAMGGGTGDLFRRAEEIGTVHYSSRPRIGDIVFFDNTFDANHNRRFDDPLTHVALVLDVMDDGTILMAHGGATHGTGFLHMNLEHPDERIGPEGQRWNDNLRMGRRGDPLDARYTTSDLWAGFATVWMEDSNLWSAPAGTLRELDDSGLE